MNTNIRSADLWKIARAIFNEEWREYKSEFPDAQLKGNWEKDKDHFYDVASEFCRALKALGYRKIV